MKQDNVQWTVSVYIGYPKSLMRSLYHEEHVKFIQFSEEIDAHFGGRHIYKGSCVYPRYPTLDITRIPVRLYLRFRVGDSWPVGSIVIAAIQFQSQRCGHGTALLHKLVELAPQFGYQNIEVEQTGPGVAIQAFVRKFGFRNSVDAQNWILSVDELQEIFSVQQARSPAEIPVAG